MYVPQLLRKMQSQFAWLDQQIVFLSDNFLMLKVLFNELKQFYSRSEKLFFRVLRNDRFFRV